MSATNEGNSSVLKRAQGVGGASPWSLRSYYRQNVQYHRGVSASALSSHHVDSIFTKNVEVGSDTISATVDGQEVVFELRENVTSRAETRPRIIIQSANVTGSSIEMRLRWWIMRYSLIQITILYFVIFIGMNFLFAGLWSIQEGRCCDNESLTFTQVFDFAVQTSATIGYGGKSPV